MYHEQSPLSNFNSYRDISLKDALGGSYGLNVKAVLAQVKRFGKDNGLTEQIAVVFDWRQRSGPIEQDVRRAIHENDDDGRYLSVQWERQSHRPPL